jgi:hypothetical protein
VAAVVEVVTQVTVHLVVAELFLLQQVVRHKVVMDYLPLNFIWLLVAVEVALMVHLKVMVVEILVV